MILLKLFEYQNAKIFLQQVMLQIRLKKFLSFKKLKILCRGHVINNLNGEGHCWKFSTKNNYKKQIKKNLKLEK